MAQNNAQEVPYWMGVSCVNHRNNNLYNNTSENNMIFKYKGKEMEVPDNFIMMCGQAAEERGMTLEEYIAEAFTMLKESEEAHDKTSK